MVSVKKIDIYIYNIPTSVPYQTCISQPSITKEEKKKKQADRQRCRGSYWRILVYVYMTPKIDEQ